MEKKKLLKLQERGWKVGNASDFLGLSQEESEYVELKVSLAGYLQKKRQTMNMTQEALAQLMHSSQSRVAKMEKSDSTVSIDLIVRSLLALGTSKTELAKAMTWADTHKNTLKRPSHNRSGFPHRAIRLTTNEHKHIRPNLKRA
jgi:transcriptional regulator with XRE-family HTH domain